MTSATPSRPESIPVQAIHDADENEWASGAIDADGRRQGSWRFYDEHGALRRIAVYESGVLHGLCRHYVGAEIVEELHYVAGSIDGPYWRRVEPDVYALEGAAFEVGAFDRGVRYGTVRLLDRGEHEIARFDLGDGAVDDDIFKAGVLSMFPRSLPVWLDLAERAFAEQRNEEGLAAVARAVVKGADPSMLEAALARFALPVTRAEAERRAEVLADESSPRVLFGALLAGAEPVAILRRLAAALAGSVAVDMIEAAIALASDPLPLLFARGLLRVLSGNVVGARHDARTLRFTRPSEYELLMEAIRAIEPDTLRVAS